MSENRRPHAGGGGFDSHCIVETYTVCLSVLIKMFVADVKCLHCVQFIILIASCTNRGNILFAKQFYRFNNFSCFMTANKLPIIMQ